MFEKAAKYAVGVEAPPLSMECPCGQKSFKIFSKSYRISWACTYGTLELGSLFEREIIQKLGSKINQKFIFLGSRLNGEKSYKIFSKSYIFFEW